MKYTNIFIIVVSLSMPTFAQLAQNINLGFTNTTGNTNISSLNSKYNASAILYGYNDQVLKVNFSSTVYISKSKDITNNEEYTTALNLEQSIGEQWLTFANFTWLSNEFRNFDSKITFGLGAGKALFNDDKHSLKIKLGIAYNSEQYSNTQADKTFGSLTESVKYTNKLNSISDVYARLDLSENFNNFSGDYEIISVVGIKLTMSENLKLNLEYETKYDELPATSFDKTDTKSIISIGYHF